MPQYSHRSLNVLNTCCEELQILFLEVIKFVDCTAVCGHRDELAQNKAFAEGRSRKRWPDGKHNSLPSDALDAIPFINGAGSWDSFDCVYFAGIVMGVFLKLQAEGKLPRNVMLRNGSDWDGDGDVYEPKTLKDPYHFEIVRR